MAESRGTQRRHGHHHAAVRLSGRDKEAERSLRAVAPDIFVLYDESQSFGVEDDDGLQMRDADAEMVTALSGGLLLLRDAALFQAVCALRDRQHEAPTFTHQIRLAVRAGGLDGVPRARAQPSRLHRPPVAASCFSHIRPCRDAHLAALPVAGGTTRGRGAGAPPAGRPVSLFLPYSCADLPVYRDQQQACSNATMWGRSMVNLPNWHGMRVDCAEQVVDALVRLRAQRSGLVGGHGLRRRSSLRLCIDVWPSGSLSQIARLFHRDHIIVEENVAGRPAVRRSE